MGGGCGVSGDKLTGAGGGRGAEVGGALGGMVSLRSLVADGKGTACAGTSLSGVTRDVEAGGVARRSGGEEALFVTFFTKTVGAGDAGAWAGLGGTD